MVEANNNLQVQMLSPEWDALRRGRRTAARTHGAALCHVHPTGGLSPGVAEVRHHPDCPSALPDQFHADCLSAWPDQFCSMFVEDVENRLRLDCDLGHVGEGSERTMHLRRRKATKNININSVNNNHHNPHPHRHTSHNHVNNSNYHELQAG